MCAAPMCTIKAQLEDELPRMSTPGAPNLGPHRPNPTLTHRPSARQCLAKHASKL